MKIRSVGKCFILVQNVRHAAQIEVHVPRGTFFGELLEVVSTMAKVEQVPRIVVAPVLRMVAGVCGRIQ